MFLEWLVISVIIFVLSFVFLLRKVMFQDDIILALLISLLIAFVFFVSALSFISSEAPYDTYDAKTVEYQIIAMKDTSGIKGAFSGIIFVSTGRIGTEYVYEYYYQSGDATYFGTSPQETTPVFEENRTDAVLRETQTMIYYRPTAFDPLLRPMPKPGDKRVEIHVPKGTIRRGLDVGLA